MPSIESIFENIIDFLKRVGFTIYYILFSPKKIIHAILGEREKFLIKPSIFLVIILLIIPLIWKDIQDASFLDLNSIAGVSRSIFDADFYETFLFTFPFSVVIYVLIFIISKLLFLSKRYTTLFVKLSLYYFAASNFVFTAVIILFLAFYQEISFLAYGIFNGNLNKVPNVFVSIVFFVLPFLGIFTTFGLRDSIGWRLMLVPVISGFAFFFYLELYKIFDPFILSEQNKYSIRSGYYQDDGYYDHPHYNLFVNNNKTNLQCEILFHNNANRPVFIFPDQTFAVYAEDENNPIAKFKINERFTGRIVNIESKSLNHFELIGQIDSTQFRRQDIKNLYDTKLTLHYLLIEANGKRFRHVQPVVFYEILPND
jgi:hypothetical protein